MTLDMNATSPTGAFSDDDGAADPTVYAALSAYERGDGGPADVLAALAGGRVLVPVVAVPDEVSVDSGPGPAHDGSEIASAPEATIVTSDDAADAGGAAHDGRVTETLSEPIGAVGRQTITDSGATTMASVSTIGRDGRRGLLAFTSLDSLRAWNPDARPVPVSTRSAAESALADGADALVVDLAGPVLFSVDAAGLRALASGYRPVATWSAESS